MVYAVTQVIYPLKSMLDRMGVHTSDYDLAHYLTVTPCTHRCAP